MFRISLKYENPRLTCKSRNFSPWEFNKFDWFCWPMNLSCYFLDIVLYEVVGFKVAIRPAKPPFS